MRQLDWSSERQSDLLKVTQLINGSPRILIWVCLTKACAFLPTYGEGRFLGLSWSEGGCLESVKEGSGVDLGQADWPCLFVSFLHCIDWALSQGGSIVACSHPKVGTTSLDSYSRAQGGWGHQAILGILMRPWSGEAYLPWKSSGLQPTGSPSGSPMSVCFVCGGAAVGKRGKLAP